MWVTPRGGACPLCVRPLDPAAADPPLGEVADRIGPVTHCLGEVRVRRRDLPDRGLLLATAGDARGGGGLFFLPHRPEVVIEPGAAAEPGLGLVWALAGLVGGPAALLAPALRLLSGDDWSGDRKRTVYEPEPVPAAGAPGGGGRLLAEHLMANPGAFFLPRGDVRGVRERLPRPWRGWVAECVGRPPVRWRPLSDPAGVRRELAALGRTAAWIGVVE